MGGFTDTDLTTFNSRFDNLRQDLFDATQHETGFVVRDCIDLLEASSTVIRQWPTPARTPLAVESTLPGRNLTLQPSPYGGVAIVLPRNACLYLGVLTALAALASGNKVWLKCPSSCTKTADLLSQIFEGAPVDVSTSSGREFMTWAVESPAVHLVHFIGDSRTGATYLAPLFEAGKHYLLDGNGNGYAYVHQDADIGATASDLVHAIVRFNGQTCTAVKGIIAHPECCQHLTEELVRQLKRVNVGQASDPATEVSALFEPKSSHTVSTLVSDAKGSVLTGQIQQNGLIEPILVKNPDPGSELVRTGCFAPVAWITEGNVETFRDAWKGNQYPLCASLFGASPQLVHELVDLPKMSRLTLNGDSTLEDPLEPWGALPPSGNSKVEAWTARYCRTVQLDQPVTSSYSQRR